jgi:hypothetical protein
LELKILDTGKLPERTLKREDGAQAESAQSYPAGYPTEVHLM